MVKWRFPFPVVKTVQNVVCWIVVRPKGGVFLV